MRRLMTSRGGQAEQTGRVLRFCPVLCVPWLCSVIVMMFCCFSDGAFAQQASSIINSKHNLSASGPGAIRAVAEQEVCIFCHTPHNAAPIQPLWNRNVPVNVYTPYASSSLQARPGQPTGSSKLCLSCHDGTIAVGSVLSRSQPIAMAGGITTLPPGQGNLGTDLSDDHPVSFRYDATLSAQDPKIKSPSQLPPAVKLDRNQELQCTSCHDPHNDANGKFLVMNNANSQLCNACHQPQDTNIAAHAACASCHQMHSAPSGALLLRGVNASETCLKCHSSQPSDWPGENVAPDLLKLSRHYRPPERGPMIPEEGPTPGGQANPGPQDITCASCHESHTMQTGLASAPMISPKLGQVSGVNGAGALVPTAQFQYEVCFKCHGDVPVVASRITRQIVQNNTRLEFAPSAVSFHPVQAAGKNSDVPSLRGGLTTASLIYCTDCHSSDSGSTAGGTGPAGPHGSNSPPLLVARYDTLDGTTESANAYALCYRCHDRASILGNESFSGHAKHIVDQRTPCSVCHDAHGISSTQGNTTNHAHLINFDTTVVRPDSVTGRLEYRSTGPRSGLCYLTCHNVPHSPASYPGNDLGVGQAIHPPPGPITPTEPTTQPALRKQPRLQRFQQSVAPPSATPRAGAPTPALTAPTARPGAPR